MAMVMPAGERVKQYLQQGLPASFVRGWLALAAHPFRVRDLPPERSIHLWIIQLLSQVSLEGLRHREPQVPSASALCQARQSLPLGLFYAALDHLASALAPVRAAGRELFCGLQIVLLDATSLRTPDTPELAGHYGKHQNGRRITPGYPAPKLLCLMDYATGLIRRAIDLPADRQEHMLLRRIASAVKPGQLLVADRGLVSFPFLCELLSRGAQACLRLPQKMAAREESRGSRRRTQALGEGDWRVLWTKSPCPTQAYSDQAYALLGPVLELRQICRRIERDGFRPWTLTLITTLLDAQAYPADDLVALYLKRWQVEVYFRDFKCSQKAAMLASRSLEMARKELLVHLMLFNLARSLMAQVALRLATDPSRIGFRDFLRWLLGGVVPLELLRPVINPRRTRPGEPRRLKRRRSKYPPLNQPREHYKPGTPQQSLLP